MAKGYGLRRALVLAGSETQVMSLWPVSDEGTRDLMIDYYKALKAGQASTFTIWSGAFYFYSLSAMCGCGSGMDWTSRAMSRVTAMLCGLGAALILDEFALWLNLEDTRLRPTLSGYRSLTLAIVPSIVLMSQ